MIIETPRLWIRDFNYDDLNGVHKYCSDPEVTKYMLWGPNSIEQTKDYIDKAVSYQQETPRNKYDMVIVVKDKHDEPIGNCCIYIEGSNGEIGYCLSREYWGKGYATEAAQALVWFGFREKGLHRIFATCRPSNIGSAHVLTKLGMLREGLLREHVRAKGKWHDSYLFSILEQEHTTNE